MKNINQYVLLLSLIGTFFFLGGGIKELVKNTFLGIDAGAGAALTAFFCILISLLFYFSFVLLKKLF